MKGQSLSPGDRIRWLTEEILRHRRLYYVENNPEISDVEYDAMEKELAELERKHPQFRLPWSPTLRVGGEPTASFETVLHTSPMISLDNTYNREELRAFDTRVRKALGHGVSYTVELKIDGLSLALVYHNGLLSRAVTRGDGIRGDNVLANARMIRNIPLKLPDWAPTELEIRGEVFMPFSHFEMLNRQRTEEGLEPFANPRNAAAGSMRLKNPREVRGRGLMMYGYHILTNSALPDRQIERLGWLKKIGFPVSPGSVCLPEIEAVLKQVDIYEERRHQLDFPVDGLVVKVDFVPDWERLGSTAKFPRFAVAYKFPAEQVTTKIREIVFQVGRTGVITPVAELEPVELAGTTVRRATLHNFEEIKRKDIRVGDTVFIEKGGEIIPKVVKVVSSLRTGKEIPVQEPKNCPACGAKTVRMDEEVALRCINPACPAIVQNALIHFVSRDAMDIRGMGVALVTQLVERRLVGDFSDIYHLTVPQLETLERMGRKSAENLVREIDKSRSTPYHRVLYALGIRYVGLKSAKLLATVFPTIESLQNADVSDIEKIEGIGTVIARSVHRFFVLPENRELVHRLAEAGLSMTADLSPMPGEMPLRGEIYVLTGELKEFTRKSAGEFLESLGAKVTNSVSGKTTAVIAGEKAGSKLRKAKELGIEILDESFLKKLKRETGENRWTAD